MNIFSRIFGASDWKFVEGLPENHRRDCCTVVVSSGAVPALLAENLVSPAIKIAADLGYQFRPSGDTEKFLIEEASLAILKSCIEPQKEPQGLCCLSWRQFQQLTASLYLIELSSRRSDIPSSLVEAHYSDDSEEAQTQFLVIVTNKLQISDAMAPSRMKIHGFDSLWAEATRGLLPGIDLGVVRTPPNTLLTRAQSEFKSLSHEGRNYVKAMATDFFPRLA